MIGNDVIDLELAKQESNWQRNGYLEKIFSPLEKKFISNTSCSNEMVWLLWSLKESTYKAYQRLRFQRGFYPIKIEIIELTPKNNIYYSVIQVFGIKFYGISKVSPKVIHSIVALDKSDSTRFKMLKNNSYQKDKNGLPFSLIKNEIISISHHGKYQKTIGLSLNI